MRILASFCVFCLVTGCSIGEAGEPTDTDPSKDPNEDNTGVETTVTVAFSWVYFWTKYTCDQQPTCSAPVCGSQTGCFCCVCNSCTDCLPNILTLHCCTQAANIKESDLSTLVLDYPQCDLEQTSPVTYTLDCSENAEIYWDNTGESQVDVGSPYAPEGFKYTDNLNCEWSLPYAVQ